MMAEEKALKNYRKRFEEYDVVTLENLIKTETDKIRLLESIYMSPSTFSKELKAAALKERQNLCLVTSAAQSLIREKNALVAKTDAGICGNCGERMDQHVGGAVRGLCKNPKG